MNLQSKYDLGDTIHALRSWDEAEQVVCPLCAGTRKVQVVGSDSVATCPKCNFRGVIETGTKARRFAVTELTIGQVQVTTTVDHPAAPCARTLVRYMAHETGIGGGTVYDEESLFSSEADALAAAYEAGARANDRRYP